MYICIINSYIYDICYIRITGVCLCNIGTIGFTVSYFINAYIFHIYISLFIHFIILPRLDYTNYSKLYNQI